MEEINFKNTITLKNLPSNLIEKAVIVFKDKKTVKEIQKIEQQHNKKGQHISKNTNCYAIKEAELIVTNYLKEINNKKRNKIVKNESNKKIKIYSVVVTILLLIQTIIFMATM